MTTCPTEWYPLNVYCILYKPLSTFKISSSLFFHSGWNPGPTEVNGSCQWLQWRENSTSDVYQYISAHAAVIQERDVGELLRDEPLFSDSSDMGQRHMIEVRIQRLLLQVRAQPTNSSVRISLTHGSGTVANSEFLWSVESWSLLLISSC